MTTIEAKKEFEKWRDKALKTTGKKCWEAQVNMNYFLGYYNCKKEIAEGNKNKGVKK